LASPPKPFNKEQGNSMNKKIDSAELEFLSPKKKFVFNPRILYEISKKGLGKSLEQAFEIINDELAKAYPDYIVNNQKWIFNNAGGGMAQLKLMHASIREYLIFWGTCVGTEGHSGRYRSEIFDFMLRGEMRCEYEGVFKPEVHVPGGKPAYLGSKIVKHYVIERDAFMLEYCRGNIVKMLPFGLLDSLLSALDLRTIGRLVYNYGKLTMINLFTKGKDAGAVVKMILFIMAVVAIILYGLPHVM
jgi:hypothetical protein